MAVKLTQEMIDGAKATQQKYGVPASITLGQIMLESGGSYEGGLSGLAVKGKNLFGIKGTGPAGTVYMNTKEQGSNGMYVTTAGFRKYNNFAESIDDHGKLLTSDRYTSKTNSAKTVEDYARAIHAAGYATDANYANKLINIINSNNLKQYDTGDFSGVVIGPSQYQGEALTLQNVETLGTAETMQLDLFGQVVRFVIIAALLIMAVVFFLKAFSVSVPMPGKLTKGESNNE